MVVSNILQYDNVINTLFDDNYDKISEVVDKHILIDKIEGDSNEALKLVIHYGVVHYLAIIEHEYTTSELTIEEIKDKFNFKQLNDELYCYGYNLSDLIEQIIA